MKLVQHENLKRRIFLLENFPNYGNIHITRIRAKEAIRVVYLHIVNSRWYVDPEIDVDRNVKEKLCFLIILHFILTWSVNLSFKRYLIEINIEFC